ncbi:MAG TPA: peptide ABC transporter substrate-binding protein [Chitinophagales bacterium]|nr:peptide ABC transporter substrate-binding protein [Chitinophagales bacterium]
MRIIVVAGCLLLFAAACNRGGNRSEKLTPARGGRFYGGVLKGNETEYFRSLYPLNVTEVGGHRITNQIYEGLVRFHQADLSIQPCLAESWQMDTTGLGYTFFLRKGVRFHDDACFPDGKGREVTARDFEYCLTLLCTPDVSNQGFWVFRNKVKGADNYYLSREYESLKQTAAKYPPDSRDENYLSAIARIRELEEKNAEDIAARPDKVAGITVIDDYTLRIELENYFPGFLQMLALPFTQVFPKEAVERYGTDMRARCVGTGPFKIKALREDEVVILEKNNDYWGKDEFGNQLPFLDGIKITFIKEHKSELLALKKGDLDFMYRLPLEMAEEIVDKNDNLLGEYKRFQLQVTPNLATLYYGFLNVSPTFSNKDVRIAFNYAIDRRKIVDFTIKGTGIPATHGIVPPAFKNFNAEMVKGYEFNPEKAREHLAKAGYPDGKGFPAITLQINSGGGTNEQVAEAVQKMLQENLNIRVNIIKLPFAQHLENLETGKAEFWRLGWIADYPDPENFLNLFYSAHIPPKLSDKSYLNSVRYRNPVYDSLFVLALRTVDEARRNALYAQADQVMINDAAIMPIYYYKDHRLLQPRVQNFPQNAMEYRTYRDVWLTPEDYKPLTAEAK